MDSVAKKERILPIDPVKLTQDLVRCRSVTPDSTNAQEILKNTLQDLGFKITDLPFEGRNSYPVPNFFARLNHPDHLDPLDHEGPYLAFSGHTDVVPQGDEEKWIVPPFSADIKDGILYGRGVSDMKGGIAAFIAAVSEYLEAYGPPKGAISLLITGDEEGDRVNGTQRVMEWAQETGNIPDSVIVGEPSNPENLGEEIKIGRRGSMPTEITVKGKSGHAAYPQNADNPLPKLIKILNALTDYEFDNGNDHFPATDLQPTSIDVGNQANNVIPDKATARFSLRFNSEWTSEALQAKIEGICAEFSENHEITYQSCAESFLNTDARLANLVKDAVEDILPGKVQFTTTGGISDSGIISKYCPSVVEFGLVNKTIHQPNEQARVEDIEKLTQIYKRIIERFFKERA